MKWEDVVKSKEQEGLGLGKLNERFGSNGQMVVEVYNKGRQFLALHHC